MGLEVSLSLGGDQLPASLLWHHCGKECGLPCCSVARVNCRLPTRPFLVGVGPQFVCLFLWYLSGYNSFGLDCPFPDLLARENKILFCLLSWLFFVILFLEGEDLCLLVFPETIFFNSTSGIYKAQKKTHWTYYCVIFLGSWSPYLVCFLLSTFRVFLCLLCMMSRAFDFT